MDGLGLNGVSEDEFRVSFRDSILRAVFLQKTGVRASSRPCQGNADARKLFPRLEGACADPDVDKCLNVTRLPPY